MILICIGVGFGLTMVAVIFVVVLMWISERILRKDTAEQGGEPLRLEAGRGGVPAAPNKYLVQTIY